MVGAQTSALLFGGKTNPPPSRIGVVESYDGVSFTEVNDLNTARYSPSGSGTSTATLAFGGNVPPNNGTAVTEEWNGTGLVTSTVTTTSD